MTADNADTTEAVRTNEIADRLHSVSIRLLRRLRPVDDRTGISGPRLSALSVIAFAGPVTVTELARAEQVRPATVSRMVKDLEAEGLVRRRADKHDGRVQHLHATARGLRVMRQGRARRVQVLAAMLDGLSTRQVRQIGGAVELLTKALESAAPEQDGEP